MMYQMNMSKFTSWATCSVHTNLLMSQVPLESMTAYKFFIRISRHSIWREIWLKWLKWLLPGKDEFLLLMLCWDVLSSKSIPRRFSGKVLTFSFDKGFPVIIDNKSFFLSMLHFLQNATFQPYINILMEYTCIHIIYFSSKFDLFYLHFQLSPRISQKIQ